MVLAQIHDSKNVFARSQRFRKQVHLRRNERFTPSFYDASGCRGSLHSIAMVYFRRFRLVASILADYDLSQYDRLWRPISAATFWGQFTTIVLIYGIGHYFTRSNRQ